MGLAFDKKYIPFKIGLKKNNTGVLALLVFYEKYIQ